MNLFPYLSSFNEALSFQKSSEIHRDCSKTIQDFEHLFNSNPQRAQNVMKNPNVQLAKRMFEILYDEKTQGKASK